MSDEGDGRDSRIERLRDTVEDVVVGLRSEVEIHAVIEASLLMAVADGDVSVPEYEQLATTIEEVTHRHVGPGRVRAMLDRYVTELRQDGWARRIEKVTACLPSDGSRRIAYRLAAGVSFVDGLVQDDEARLFGLLAEAFAIPLDEAAQILTEVRDQLFGFEELTQPVILLAPSRRIDRGPVR